MINKAVDEGLFEAAEVGRHKVRVSHLQYADDTIFIGKANTQNVWAIRCILKNFELLSGLKVNYNKCSLMGVNVENSKLHELARSLGCGVENLSFLYLGVKVGSIHKRIAMWDDLI